MTDTNHGVRSKASTPAGSPRLTEVSIGPGFVNLLFASCAVLAVAGLIAAWYQPGGTWRAELFDLNAEGNVPTWYSSAQLFVAALLAFACRSQGRSSGAGSSWAWSLVGVSLLYVSVDEVARLHEEIGYHLRDWLEFDGALGYAAWVVPYGAAVLVLGVLLGRFWWRLPTTTRRGFGWSAAVFFTGGFALELVEGVYDSWRGPDFGLRTIGLAQESLEMFAVALLVKVELGHLHEASVNQ